MTRLVSHPARAAPYYRIDLPRIPNEYEPESLLPVEPNSALALREEVERFACYFRREFRYDFAPYGAGSPEGTAYLFAGDERRLEEDDDFTEHADLFWVGACCFQWRKYQDLDNIPVEELGWAWLHPYFRGKGILASHWETLRKKHGDFSVLSPLSATMREFLLKYNQGSMWYPAYEGKELDLAAVKARLQELRDTRA
jgi:hypothetical protein